MVAMNSDEQPQMIAGPEGLNVKRPVYRCHVGSWEELRELTFPSEHFVLLLAADYSAVEGSAMVEVARKLIAKGNAYLCAWGDACEEGETQWEAAAEDAEEKYGFTAMATSHDEETLEEAVWYALNCAFVDKHIEKSTSVVLVTVGEPQWKAVIEGIFEDPEAFEDRELED